MVTSYVKVVTCCQEPPTIKSHDHPIITWYREITWQIKNALSATKKTYEHQTRQGDDLSWEASTHKVTQPFDYVTNVRSCYKLRKNFFTFMATLLSKADTYRRKHHKPSPIALWSRGYARSCHKLKSLFSHYYKTCCRQTSQSSDLLWGIPTHKLKRFFGRMVMWGHRVN